MPAIERKNNVIKSLDLIFRFLYTKGNKIIAPKKNLRKTNVKGGTWVSVSL